MATNRLAVATLALTALGTIFTGTGILVNGLMNHQARSFAHLEREGVASDEIVPALKSPSVEPIVSAKTTESGSSVTVTAPKREPAQPTDNPRVDIPPQAAYSELPKIAVETGPDVDRIQGVETIRPAPAVGSYRLSDFPERVTTTKQIIDSVDGRLRQ